MLEEIKNALAELLFGTSKKEDDYYKLALKSGFTQNDAQIFARIAYRNNLTVVDINEVIEDYNSFTLSSGSPAMRIWYAFQVLGGLSEIVSWLEFPSAIDAVKKLKIDPIIVQRALDNYAYGSLINQSKLTLVKLNWEETDGSKRYATNLILDTETGIIFLVIVEATAELALGELVGIGRTIVVADNVVMKSKIFKDVRTKDVYYQSDSGVWLITGPSTGSPEMYPVV